MQKVKSGSKAILIKIGGVLRMKKLREIHRALTPNFSGHLNVSDRPCFSCAQCRLANGRDFAGCKRTSAHTLRELEVIVDA